MLNDDRVDDFVESIGARLVRGDRRRVPAPSFRYTFDVVNQKEINAFALPGGPMFLNRGMIEAARPRAKWPASWRTRSRTWRCATARRRRPRARSSRLARCRSDPRRDRRRHGRQRDRAGLAVRPRRLLPEVQPRVREPGRPAGRADHGARRLRPARDGQHVQDDPGGGRRQRPGVAEQPPEPGQPLRRHHPGSLDAARRGAMATPGSSRRSSRGWPAMPPAYTAEQIAKGQTTTGPRTVATGGRRVVNVEPPSNSYRTYQPSDFLRVSVPANWDAVDASAGSVTYAPDGGFVQGTQRRLRVHARRAGGRGAGRRRQPAAGHAAVAPEPLAVESGPARRGELQTRDHRLAARASRRRSATSRK